MIAMKSIEIDFGHAFSHSPWLVQDPKNSSMVSTMFDHPVPPFGLTLREHVEMGDLGGGEQVGRRVRAGCDTGTAADARRGVHRRVGDTIFGTGIRLASGAEPVGTLMNPPEAMIRSKASRSTIRSFMIGKPAARHGSTVIVSPSLNDRMCSWQAAVARLGSVSLTVDHHTAGSADPFAAVRVEDDRLFVLDGEPLVEHVEHLEERHVLFDVVHLVGLELAVGGRSLGCRQT